MSYAHITVDGKTILDRDISNTQTAAPVEIAKYLTPGVPLQPGLIQLMSALGFAIKAGQDITANLRNRPTGYDLTVDHG